MMRKMPAIVFLIIGIALVGCRSKPIVGCNVVSQENIADGFIDNWQSIQLIDPPPPAPFRLMQGDPIDLAWVKIPDTGPAGQLTVNFVVSMSRVGQIEFRPGSAPGVAAVTSKVQTAMNTWLFTNNGNGSILMVLNFGSNKVTMDFSQMHVVAGASTIYDSFYSVFLSRQGNIVFNKQ